MRTWTSRGPVIMAVALLGPAVAGWLLSLVRDLVDNANAALVLVLVVVGVAASGRRLAGIVAALSATAWFDFFLTEPYLTFTINDRNDLETAALLILVGLAVTELSLWGRRQQARASLREGYLSGVATAARIVAAGGTPTGELVERIAEQITTVLDVDGCRYDQGVRPSRYRLRPDGTLTDGDRTVDVDRTGLPTDDVIELPVQHAGVGQGRFLITAAARVARPTLEQRLVAVTLAEQAAAGLISPAR